MTNTPIPIPKGALFTVTSGCYSDYTVMGVFRALEEIDVYTLRDAWIARHPEQAEDYHFDERAFLASLAHMMEPMECWELHLTDYSNVKEINVSKM